ncbi:MAG: hypothetical protein K2X98_01970 [Alphaproteobacteria bacterium]|nr:hypothetical protein [Alphaproteobacteria bacterium]
MHYIFKNVIIGTLLTTVFSYGEGNTKAATGESTVLLPITKEITKAIDTAKNAQDAWDKLCGKKLLKGGILRSPNAMKLAKEQQYFATMVAGVCHNYPGFDSSTIAKIVKEKLWGKERAEYSFEWLMDASINATTVEFKRREKDGTWHIIRDKGGVVRTVEEELIHYAEFPMMTNIKYPLCTVKKKGNLPLNMKNLELHAICGSNEQVATIKNPPPRPTKGSPVEYTSNIQSSLKDLEDPRKSKQDDWHSGRNYAEEALRDLDTSFDNDDTLPHINIPQPESPKKGKDSKESLLQGAKNLSSAMNSMTRDLKKSQQSTSHQNTSEDPIALAEKELERAKANYSNHPSLATKKAQSAAVAALAKAKASQY